MSLMMQEIFTLPGHMSSPLVPCVIRVAQSLVFYAVFCRPLFLLLSFVFLAIVLSVRLRYTASNYRFGIFKLLVDAS